MLPFGHTAIGYLISQSASKRLKRKEILAIILSANIFDLDFIIPHFHGYPGGIHHSFPTHTPLAGFIYFLFLYFLFRNKLSKTTFKLMAVAMLSHLILDDLSYWLSLVGLEKPVDQQINWLYPFKRLEAGIKELSNLEVLKKYLFEYPKLFYLEILITLFVIGTAIKRRFKLDKF